MTSHETYREQLLDLAYGELGKREARALRAHLESCPGCRAELERMTATRSAMSALPAEEAPERGEAILLAAARQAAAERRRPWLPSWVWATSVGVVGVAAVALVAVRLAGVVKPPLATHPPDALVSQTLQEDEAKVAAPEEAAADSAPAARSSAAAAEPAPPPTPAAPQPAAPSAAKRAAAPAAKPAAPPRKAKGAAAEGFLAKKDSRLDDRKAAGGAGAAPSAAPPEEMRFAQPPPAAPAPEPMMKQADRDEARAAPPGSAEDKEVASSAGEKRELAAGPARSLRAKARAGLEGVEDAIARYERLRAAGKLRAASAEFRDCAGEASRQVETDEQGRTVKVIRRGVRAGGAYQAEQFYGEDGQLGAVRYRAGGSTRELRVGLQGNLGAAGDGVPAWVLQPAHAAEAKLDAPPRCQE